MASGGAQEWWSLAIWHASLHLTEAILSSWKNHRESLIHWTMPPWFTKIAFIWLDERLLRVQNDVIGRGHWNEWECFHAFGKQSHLSRPIRKYKSALSLYPCTQVCLIISRGRRVLKSSLQSASIWPFLCVLINLSCSPGVTEWVEMWKLVRDEYQLKLQLLKKSNPSSPTSTPLQHGDVTQRI